MNHVAIMKKSWGLIPKIISGQKTIESRWYQTRRAPWNEISEGDVVYFKNSGEAITARAEVARVKRFEMRSLADSRMILKRFGKQICAVDTNPATWPRQPRYCILIFLKNPSLLRKPFRVSKKGFGSATAWLVMKKVRKLPFRVI
jgi:ASC-1-like (ASCH) protein